MNIRRQSLLTEPPASATSDIAFILIIFFLVCASVEPEEGRQQIIPKNEKDEKKEKTKTINVDITPTDVIVNVPNSRDGRPVETYKREDPALHARLTAKLTGALVDRAGDEQRVVAVMCKDDSTPYYLWMDVTDAIEQAGGIITLVREEVVNVQ
ncbi:MAG: biopolymer transporter ExbD [Verrucomicrobiota bacterium]|nr:biopolymer transporter ExbD [Verrucomicrobiota bacterium]